MHFITKEKLEAPDASSVENENRDDAASKTVERKRLDWR